MYKQVYKYKEFGNLAYVHFHFSVNTIRWLWQLTLKREKSGFELILNVGLVHLWFTFGGPFTMQYFKNLEAKK